MMGNYSAYADYKDSGVEWLGEIPEHWDCKKLKFLAIVQPSNVDKKTLEGEELVFLCNYSDVYNNDWITDEISFMQASATSSEIEKFLISKGDVIITKDSENPYDIAVPALVYQNFDNVLCGYHLTHIKPIKLDGKFLFRLFQSSRFNAQFIVSANGVTRFGLPQRVINDAYVATPPLDEQKAIAAFLDYKTQQIDQLIAKKEALLEKLDEKRTALISQAVTKGLDPTVPMKDSGIEWLGEIPEHWETKKIQYIGRLKSGENIISQQIEPDGLYPVFGGNGIRGYFDSYNHDGHYILIGRQGALCGNINYANGKFWASEHAVVVNPLVRFEVFWLGELLKIMNLNQYSTSAAQPGLSVEQIARLKIPFPPFNEQKVIAQYLSKKTVEIDRQKVKILQAIEVLKEYRTALITNAVTGKIDVRSVPIPTP